MRKFIIGATAIGGAVLGGAGAWLVVTAINAGCAAHPGPSGPLIGVDYSMEFLGVTGVMALGAGIGWHVGRWLADRRG